MTPTRKQNSMVYEIPHPLVKTLVNRLRSSQTDALRFRRTVAELAKILVYEAFAPSQLTDRCIPTWQGQRTSGFIAEEELVFVPILRAGLPMLDGVIELFSDAQSGFLAMKRDETTHQSVLYYDRLPECAGKTVILLDPMVATGGSLCDALAVVKSKAPKKIISLNIIGSPEGLEVVKRKHPDIDLYIAQIDERLDENMYIIPGLGDAGDRAYNTPE